MNDPTDIDTAARIAHGALTGVVGDPRFDTEHYLRSELADIDDTRRGRLLVHAFAAAVYSHAGTLRGAQLAGIDIEHFLVEYPRRRAQLNQPDEPDAA